MSRDARAVLAGALAATCAACTVLAALDAHEGAVAVDGGPTDALDVVDGGGGDTAVLADGALPASCIGVLRLGTTATATTRSIPTVPDPCRRSRSTAPAWKTAACRAST